MRTSLPLLGCLSAIILGTAGIGAQVNVLSQRYDAARTGANLAETALTTTTVNAAQFGKLYAYPVDGAVYAQPLYVAGVVMNGTPHNVLFVATMNDKVYAFDADSSSPSPLWMRDFTNPPSVTPVPITDIVGPNLNIVGNVGIQGTPVIDGQTIYLVARTKESGSYVQRLHALDIASGLPRAGGPVTIAASVIGTAPDSTPGAGGQVVTFNPRMQSQRAGLAISNGVVLIAWASHEDAVPYHGWVLGYDKVSLARVGTFCVTPDVYAGGIWQGGRAPTIDAAGNAYFATGNGAWDGARSFGDSLVKLSVSPTAGLSRVDYFTPGNQATLNAVDDDLSGSGFTLLPGTRLLVGGGKEGVLYVLNADNLGQMTPNDTQIVQKIPVAGGHVMGGVVYWNSATLGPLVFNWSEDDVLKSYRQTSTGLTLPPYAQGQVASPGHPGGSLTLSANGNTSGTGIVWASMPTSEDAKHGLHAGILRAFHAETLNEIWTSEQNASRDRVGTLMKFVPPVVVNGRVYLPNQDNAVVVYGLLPPAQTAAGTIGIDFTGTSPTAMAPAESAGVVPKTNWNNASGASSAAPLALVDDSGARTSATVTWSAPGGGWMTPVTDQPGNVRMMKGYLDTSSSGLTTVTVAGLTPRTYDVYVYVDGDNKIYDRSAAYTIRGAGITTTTIALTDAANTNFISTFTPASNSSGNYVKFSINAGGFTLDATPTAPESGVRRAPVNGIQIVPTVPPPPPADFTLAVSPSSRTAAQGSAATYTVTIGALNGFTGTVSLGVTGAPAGATATIAPSSVTGSGTATLTVTSGSATPAGSSTLNVSATSGALRHSAVVTLIVQAAATTATGAIGIDFTGTNPATMAAGEIAGVVPKPNWNTAAGASSAGPLALVDDAGARTNATVTWSAPAGGWMTPIVDQPGDARMMKGYLDTSNTSTTTVTVAGLAPRGYDVYVYVDGDNKIYDRSAAYTISGNGITTTTMNLTDAANANFASTFTPAANSSGNYVRFSIDATGFTIEASPTDPIAGTRRAPINGLQIVPTSPPPPAPGFAIDFVGGATAMASTESAGVVPMTHWNGAAGAASSAPLALVDDSGAASGATVTWSANGAWMTPIADQAGSVRMMKGYLDTSSTSVTTVTVAGLPSSTYDVYVYADGDNRIYTRSASYRISGPGIVETGIDLTDAADTNYSGTFVQATNGSGNYVKFSVTGAGFTLTATPGTGTNATLRAPVNAIQIVPASR